MLKKLSEITEKYANEDGDIASTTSEELLPSESGDVYAQLEKAYNEDRRGLIATLLGVGLGKQQVGTIMGYRDRQETIGSGDAPMHVKWPSIEGIRVPGSTASSLDSRFVKSSAIIKLAELSIREDEARMMVKAMLGSQLVDGWIVSKKAYVKLHRVLFRLLHPDTFDGRIEQATMAGKDKEAEAIRRNKQKARALFSELATIKKESLSEGGDAESNLLNGMDDMNSQFPFSRLINFMLNSPEFPGFYLNDLVSILVDIDKELPDRFKIGPEKLQSFMSKEGISLDFDYISDNYKSYHSTEDSGAAAWGEDFQRYLVEDESEFAFSPYERLARDSDPTVRYSPDSDPLSERQNLRQEEVQAEPVPDYDPSAMGRNVPKYMEDFVSRFNVPPIGIEAEEYDEDEESEEKPMLQLTGAESMNGFYKLFNNG